MDNQIHRSQEPRRPVSGPYPHTFGQPVPPYDPNGPTQPTPIPPPPFDPGRSIPSQPAYVPPPLEEASTYQPIRRPPPASKRRPRRPLNCGCIFLIGLAAVLLILAVMLVIFAFLFSPGKTNILVLGVDRTDNGSGAVTRSDTMVLVQVDPLKPGIATLAIPRDLWVTIPSVGENRINTAHFYAEANQAGSGPAAAIETVWVNFGVSAAYYVRFHLEGVPALVDAMGGVKIDLKEATALYPAGVHQLDGKQALAFVRDRKNADDFFRMEHGELFIKAAAQQALNPITWLRLPLILAAFSRAVDTNLPITQLPALGLTLLRVGPANIDSHTLPREATTPTTLSSGAMVLMPRWDQINPLVKDIFGK